ncbi:MAG TPA: lysylphosphatidylglycerol synthase transmembrane domain-containing protein [Gammaproteobacteria bacterium]|nr:lysylphosphatidylglycerol synthase transmembrane domain-containing protein [Gammaproteobacteria bacterium]
MGGVAAIGVGSPETGKIFVRVAKCAVAVALVWLIAREIDWSESWREFRSAGFGLVAVVFAMLFVNVFISALRWGLLLRIHSVAYSLWTLSAHYFVAIFFNNFLPSNIGGDGYRIYKTLDNERGKTSAVIAVLAERLSGIGVLILLGFGAAQILEPRTPDSVSFIMAAVAVGAVAAPIAAWTLRSRLPGKLKKLTIDVGEHIDDYGRRPGLTLAAVALSAAFHLMLALAYYLAIRHSGAQHASILELLVALAIGNIVAVLPISFNGIGVFEGAFMYLLAQYGVPYEASVIPMILNRVLLVPLSAIGAAIYFGNRLQGWAPKRVEPV